MESPRERMNISDVVAQLHLIRDKILKTRRHRERLQLTGKLFMTQYLLLLTPPLNHYGGRGIIYPTQCYVLVTVLSFVLAKLIILMLCEIWIHDGTIHVIKIHLICFLLVKICFFCPVPPQNVCWKIHKWKWHLSYFRFRDL